MGIISIENTDRLYWLGRYTERVYSTIRTFESRFDSMLDLDELRYVEFCKNQTLGIVAQLYRLIQEISLSALGFQSLIDLLPCAVFLRINFTFAVLCAAALSVQKTL